MVHNFYIILILLLILFLIYFLKPKHNIEEHFTDNIKIIQSIKKGFKLDDYTDEKKSFQVGGIWNMDKTDFYLQIGKDKYYIKDNKNIYHFDIKGHSGVLTYSKTSGKIVIDNHTDEIEKISKDNGYQFKRGNKVLATIKLDSKNNNEKKYTLKIEENPEYKWIYIVTFIIYNQKNKEMMDISLDELWKNT